MTILNGNLFPAFASLYQSAYEPATTFYKSPDSQFASGSVSESSLLAQTRQSYTEFNFEAAVGPKTTHVQNEQILREINLAWKVKVKKVSPLYSQADLSSPQLAQLKPQQMLEIQSINGAFAQIRDSKFKVGFVLTSSLETLDSDPGHWVNMAQLDLKTEAKQGSKKSVTIPALTRLSLLKIQNGYGLFKTSSHQGYALLSDVVGRVDFAEYGWDHTNKRWERILYRDGIQVVVIPNRKVELHQFRAFRGQKNRALISGQHPTLAKGTRVDLVKPQAVRWTQSDIKGHGLVWWKRDLLKDTLVGEKLTTAQLLKKNLTAMSYDSKTKKGLASAGGIYKTVDGKIWKKISFFGNDDWPVCIHPAGVWFVGTYRSTDEGQNFEPSLKFSEIARLLQNAGKRNRAFIHFKVIDIEPLSKSQVLLKIDTGVTVSKLKSHVLSNQWMVLK